jgi:hypothetical protein
MRITIAFLLLQVFDGRETRCNHYWIRRNLSVKMNRWRRWLGGGERGLMHLVPAPAVKLMKSRVLSRPGVKKVEVRRFPLGFSFP